MPTEKERLDVLKSMAYDLIIIVEKDPEKTYTAEDIKKMIQTYIAVVQQ